MLNIEITKDISEYFDKLREIGSEPESVPVYISDDRIDIKSSISLAQQHYKGITKITTSSFGMILNDALLGFKNYNFFANKWIKQDKFDDIPYGSAITIIGLYEDFNQISVLELLQIAKKQKINVYFLIGRDLSSLTWMIAKQFFFSNEERKGLFTHKNLSEDFSFRNKEWSIFDIKNLKNDNIKEKIDTNGWDSLVFHGHGKEDHLNLADFTLSGLNDHVESIETFAPSIGHKGQSYFKDIDKAIPVNKIKSSDIYLLSCTNLPFYDSRLYDPKFNLVMNFIDGIARNIVASISVQSADSPELQIVLKCSDIRNAVSNLHSSLDDIQEFPSLITIGLPKSEVSPKSLFENVNQVRMLEDTKSILSRISGFSGSLMIPKEHEITRMAQKIWSDYTQKTRRGTYGATIDDTKEFEKALINRVNPFSKKIMELMIANPYDDLHDFDSFNTFRSTIDKATITSGICVCGGQTLSYEYIPEINGLFPLESTYCYRCGDKYTKMINMPDIVFSSDEENSRNLKIHYRIEITPKQKGDVYYNVQLPSYVASSVIHPDSLHRIRFKNIRTEIIEGEIEFEPGTILQSYYLKLVCVQNAGISFSRSFFNLVEPTDLVMGEKNENFSDSN